MTPARAPRRLLAAAALPLLTALAYAGVMEGGFIWDDGMYVESNPTLRSVEGLRRIWLDLRATPQYYPLVHTSFWVEYQLFGLDPRVYHAVNVALHALGALLFWRVLARLGVPGAWLAGAIFALHPVHVESVAWITERKNVLSGALYLGAAWAYLHHALAPPGARSRGAYALAFALFLGALLSKTVTCSLPAALLLVLVWQRGRVERRDVVPLLPFFAAGLALGLLTVWLEKVQVGARGEAWDLSLAERVLVAGRALGFYLGKLAWPRELSFVYPRWQIDAGEPAAWLAPAAAVVLVGVLWWGRRRLGGGPLVAALFFAGTLFPALGFFDVFPMQFSFVADHFQYHASLGPIALAAAGLARAARRLPARALPLARVGAAGLLLLLGALTWRQVPSYESREVLWRHTLARNPGAWIAHNNLSDELARRGALPEALSHLRSALAIDPERAIVHLNLGRVLRATGWPDAALVHLRRAVALEPHNARARLVLGRSLLERGRPRQAARELEAALERSPGLGPAAVAALRRARAAAAGTRRPSRPDLLLVTLDTTRADRLGLYGHGRDTSPVLDALAAEGVVFDLAIAQAAVTPVSHASILTGLDPHHHGLRVLHGREQNRLPEPVETLAEVWGRAGGRSAAFVSAYPAGAEFGLAQGFDHFDEPSPPSGEEAPQPRSESGIVSTGLHQRRADATTDAALAWLDARGAGAPPLLLWVHYFDPHDAFVLPDDAWLQRFPASDASRPALLRAIYEAEIAFMDDQLGRLLAGFGRVRSLERAVVAVVADHGEGLGDHDWWSHGLLYQEQIRIPLVIRAPGLAPGRRIASLVRSTDLTPTLLELAGVAKRLWPAMDGESLLPAVRDGRLAPGRLAYADSVNMLRYARADDPRRRDAKLDKLYSLFDGRFKLIHHQLHPRRSEFFDLAEDPGELRDLASTRPRRMRQLRRQLEALGAFSELRPDAPGVDSERARRLRSLGYAQ